MATNRADLIAGVTTMMTAFIAANPTKLLRHFRSRPMSAITDWPCSWLDIGTTNVTYAPGGSGIGLRLMAFTPSIVFVDRPTENGQVTDELAVLADLFMDHLDSYSHLVAGTWWSDGTWSEEAMPVGDNTFAPAVRWTFGSINFENGRN